MAKTDGDNGLVIFIRRFPAQIIEPVLRARLQPFLGAVGIQSHEFELHKPRGKGIATMHVIHREKAERFLANMKRFPSTLGLHPRFIVQFERHDRQDGGALVRDNKFIEKVEAEAYLKTSVSTSMKGTSS